MAEVRAITPSFFGCNCPNWAIISSVRPSAKYSSLESPLRFSNGSTASIVFPEGARDAGALCHPIRYAAQPRTITAAEIAIVAFLHQKGLDVRSGAATVDGPDSNWRRNRLRSAPRSDAC